MSEVSPELVPDDDSFEEPDPSEYTTEEPVGGLQDPEEN